MTDDTTQQLRRSLHSHADGLPYVPDLGGPAIRRARGIRRRRRAAAVAGVAAVIAVGIPLGLQVGGGTSSSEPPFAIPNGAEQVDLDLAALPAAHDLPDIPYRQFDVYLFGDASYDLGGLDPYEIAAWDAGAALLVSEGGDLTGTLYIADGTGPPQSIATGVASIGASADGQYLAYVTGGRLVVRDATEEDGRPTPTSVPVPDGAEVVAVSNGAQVLVTPEQGPSLLMDRRGVDSRLQEGITAWSLTDGLQANVTGVDDSLNECSAVRDGSQQVLWRTCEWTVREFSPDGRWAYATPSNADGTGVTQVAVLDAFTGDVLRSVRLVGGDGTTSLVQDAAWEPDGRLLLRVLVEGRSVPSLLEERGSAAAAVVRFDVPSGDAELAAGPAEVPYGRTDYPYLLT